MKKSRTPKRLRRSESFLGIHFDFHAEKDCTGIGKTVTPAMIENIIQKVKPDYIQVDCKGGPGLASYPTRVGTQAPRIAKDALRIWRDVTAKHGIALYVHYSGLYDREATRRHPSWARMDEKGKRVAGSISMFGPYVDKLMIPQLKELCDEYDIDGVWVDGECWETYREYSKPALKAFREKTGIRTVPRKPSDPYFAEFTEFFRETFREYLRHYVTEMYNHNADFQICSNWAYSSFMPEPVSADVAFLSGDYSMVNSINTARHEARFFVHQGICWDLMAWCFGGRMSEGNFSTKSVVQMQQSASIILALGGGFEGYFTQKKDGSINEWEMDVMAEIARFCRDRQRFCHNAEPVPQIALLHPGKAIYQSYDERLFFPGTVVTEEKLLEPMQGVMQNLLDSQQVVDTTMAHQLTGRVSAYPLVVIPEWNCVDRRLKKELLDYVASGGNLLAVGPEAAAQFKKQLGVQFVGKPEHKENWIYHANWVSALKTVSQKVRLKTAAKAFGRIYAENDHIGPWTPAASIAKYGKGRIAAVYLNLGERYCNARTSGSRDFLSALVRRLFPKPLVEVTGSHFVDVTANRLAGKLMINLVNTAGGHDNDNIYVFDEILPVGPLGITIRTGKRPKKITLQPDGADLKFIFSKGETRLTLPSLEIHQVLVVEPRG
jgi:hypothetical protein